MDDGKDRVAACKALSPLMVIDTHGAQICPGVICTLLNLQWTHSGNDKAHYHNYLHSTAVDHFGSSMLTGKAGCSLINW